MLKVLGINPNQKAAFGRNNQQPQAVGYNSHLKADTVSFKGNHSKYPELAALKRFFRAFPDVFGELQDALLFSEGNAIRASVDMKKATELRGKYHLKKEGEFSKIVGDAEPNNNSVINLLAGLILHKSKFAYELGVAKDGLTFIPVNPKKLTEGDRSGAMARNTELTKFLKGGGLEEMGNTFEIAGHCYVVRRIDNGIHPPDIEAEPVKLIIWKHEG